MDGCVLTVLFACGDLVWPVATMGRLIHIWSRSQSSSKALTEGTHTHVDFSCFGMCPFRGHLLAILSAISAHQLAGCVCIRIVFSGSRPPEAASVRQDFRFFSTAASETRAAQHAQFDWINMQMNKGNELEPLGKGGRFDFGRNLGFHSSANQIVHACHNRLGSLLGWASNSAHFDDEIPPSPALITFEPDIHSGQQAKNSNLCRQVAHFLECKNNTLRVRWPERFNWSFHYASWRCRRGKSAARRTRIRKNSIFCFRQSRAPVAFVAATKWRYVRQSNWHILPWEPTKK